MQNVHPYVYLTLGLKDANLKLEIKYRNRMCIIYVNESATTAFERFVYIYKSSENNILSSSIAIATICLLYQ